jgi:hypothetical protein
VIWFVGCEENLVDVSLHSGSWMYVVAQLRVEVAQDPQRTVFRVWTQEMVVEAQPKYDKRFANGLG